MKRFTPTHWLVALGLVVAAVLVLLRMAVFGPSAPARVDLDTRTFTLQALPPGDAEDLIAPYVFTDRETDPGSLSVMGGAITVRETPDNLEKIARVIEEYDRPRGDVRLHFRLVEAGDFAAEDPRIAEVEEELRELFRHRGYRLAAQAFATATHGGRIWQGLSGGSVEYEVEVHVYHRPGGLFLLEDVTLLADGRSVLSTTVNIRPGQTLVLGSSDTTTDGRTLFLTVRAEPAAG